METHPRFEEMRRLEHLSPSVTSEVDQKEWRSKPKLFISVFCIVIVVGLIYTLLQPIRYRSSATVLMSAPTAIDAAVSEADIQSVAIQRKILLGEDITLRLASELSSREAIRFDRGELRGLLWVDPVPDTNLVEMYAQGSQEELLPLLVDSWIDVYLAIRGEEIEHRKQQTLQVVQDELDGLQVKLVEARAALESYRRKHEIISVERQENEVLARLDGLNKALNNAIEEEAKSRAYLETLRQAITSGGQVVPQSERRAVEELNKELRDLQVQYTELTKRYTSEYIEKQPQMRAIPLRIEELKTALASALSEGRNTELASASQAYAAARQTAADLRVQLEEHKQKVARFNAIYATHQALVEDLAGLEQLNRDTLARQVQVEVRQVEKYPQVSVIERPARDAERIGPDYPLLLGTTFGLALGLGVFSVWLVSFLSPKPAQPAYVTLSGVHMYPQDGSQLGYSGQSDQQLPQDSTARLTEQSRTEREQDSEEPSDGRKP